MKKEKIIVVEDNPIIANDIKNILEEDNYNVVIDVGSVNEAKDILKTESPDLMLIDIKLNGTKDGVDLGRELLVSDAVPYIYISSYSDKMTLERVKETRPQGFLVKPFKAIDLKTIVALVIYNNRHKQVDPVRESVPLTDDITFRIRNAINYINDNIETKIDLSDVASISKYKVHHFIRVFTRQVGMTPYQYILNRKIDKAKAALEDSDLAISAIAFDYGFLSYSNFWSAFKKVVGMSPEEYRIHQRIKSYRNQELKN